MADVMTATLMMLAAAGALLVAFGGGAVIGVRSYRAGWRDCRDDLVLDPGETTGRLDAEEPQPVEQTPVVVSSRPKHARRDREPIVVAPPVWPDANAEDTQQIQAVRVDA